MIPVRILLSGFMSYREEQCFNFDSASLWVLSGPNGAGKSTVFDAITFVLFGEYRDQKQNLSDLVNHNSDRATVIFDFRLGNDLFRVTRTIKKSGATNRFAYFFIPASNGQPERFDPIPETDKDDGFKKWVDAKVGLNYETFTASVLLQQNKSDKLLDANTEKRFKILTKLIDLSRYIELEKRAAARQKSWKDKSTEYGGQLKSLSPVSEHDLIFAKERVVKANQSASEAAECVTYLTNLFGESQRWDTLNQELLDNREKVEKNEKLLGQSDIITQKHQRYQMLLTSIPTLTNVLEAHQRLSRSIEIEKQHQSDYDRMEEPFEKAVVRQEELAKEHEQQEQLIQTLEDKRQAANDTMLDLATTLNGLNQIKELEAKQALQMETLNSLPSDIEEQLVAAQKKETQSAEAKSAIGWLRNIDKNRTGLKNDLEKKSQLAQQRESKRQEVTEADHAQQHAEILHIQAEEAERNAHTIQVEADTKLREVQKKDERFNQVKGDKNCRYCGQPLTLEHIETEKMQLARELEESKHLAQEAKEKQKLASDQLKESEKSLDVAKQKVEKANVTLKKFDDSIRELDQNISRFLVTMGEAYSVMFPYYQMQIASICPDTPENWMGTVYPTKEDINRIQREGDLLKTWQEEVEGLRKVKLDHSQAETLLKSIKTDLDAARVKLPPDAEKSIEKNEEAQRNKITAEGALRDARNKMQALKDDQENISRSIKDLQTKRTAAQKGASNEQTRQIEINTSLKNDTQQLDLAWLPMLNALDQKQIKTLETERNNLVQNEDLFRGLDVARQTAEHLSGQITELEQQIGDIPKAARVDPEKVRNQLDVAQKKSSEAENEKSQAEVYLQSLEKRKCEREDVESKKLVADRKMHLFGILTEQFGEQGIQQALINRAEREIVNKANDVLYNLSAGRWLLDLREQGKNKKALDVVVYDAKTGGAAPIPVVLASGSQRFRIAISLALAIGQYIRRESRRIESVIIDEGFGSLDKVGRDDTIQELRNLHQHLERIILVSHQEEFYSTFSTGYAIDIINGASKVTLIER